MILTRAAASAALTVGVWAVPATAQNLSPAERAGMSLTTAKAAFNDQNYETAAEQFRLFLRTGAGTRTDVAAARYGLGVALIDGPAKDYKGAVEVLQSAAQVEGFKDRAYAAYYLGVAYRNMADQARAVAATQPTKTNASRRPGDQQLIYAATNFGNAAELFAATAPATVSDDKELPAEWQWVAKARCDEADALIRLGQFKQAALVASTLLEDAKLNRSRYRDQAAYDHGYASFGLKDYASAVRSLSTLAPFDQPDIGVHARYLLGRVHHLAGERPEAIVDYQALVTAWESLRRNVKGTPPAAPDYVARAMFYWGVALQEFGRADEAMSRFIAAVEVAPGSAVATEARLRAAQSGVQVRKFREALTMIAPLENDPQYADQALRLMAKAQYGIGTVPVPKGTSVTAVMNAVPDPVALAAGIKQSIETLRKADERAAAMASAAGPKDTEAAGRRAAILVDLGDMLQLDRQFKEAATSYATAAASPAAPAGVAEQALARQAVALQLAGDYAAADKICSTFLQKYPASASRADVMLRFAEDALLAAHAAKDPAAANTDTSKRPFGEAIVRFNGVISTYPDTYQANLARMGVATIHYLQGQFAEAAGLLAKIPESDRVDDLVGVGFLLADCELRALPDAAEDALSSARLAAQLEKVITQLEAFATSKANDPASADALVRIGYASNKLAGLLADPVEKRRTQAKARRAYADVVQKFPNHPMYAVALLEGAKIQTQTGGPAPAMMALSKFQVAPLDASPVAPLALIHLADAQRLRRHPEEAISLLTTVRAEHEAAMLKDPQRAEWVPAMRFSLALAYKEAGKYAEAKELFEKIAKDFPKRPEADEAAWRVAQCQTEPAMLDVEGLRKALAAASRPATQAELLASLLESTKKLRAAAEQMTAQAAAVAAKDDSGDSDLPAKMHYDAAWCWKIVAEVEIEAAKRQAAAQAVKKIAERIAADEPKRSPANILASIRPPEIPLTSVPPQPGEKLAHDAFRKVIDIGGESPLVDEARLELAELDSTRGDNAGAIAALKDVLAKDVDRDRAERLKIRLASLQLANGDPKAAAALATEVLSAQRNAYVSYARAIAVEAAYRQKDWAGTIEAAQQFLDAPRGIGRMQGISDLALLRMADAQGQLGQWAQAKQTLDAWFARFPSGYFTHEAKFAYGWVNENLKQTDAAVTAYADVAARAGGELGAKANLQVGRLRLAQNRPSDALTPLLTVAYAVDDPDLNPAALCEAAKALVQLKKPEDAKRLLARVTQDYPTSAWATTAKQQLAEIK